MLSYSSNSERMIRWNSMAKVEEALSMHRLNSCDECAKQSKFRLFSTNGPRVHLTLDMIGKRVARQRKLLGHTQLELAKKLGTRQTMLSFIETGKRYARAIPLVQVCHELGLELIAIPRHLLPFIIQYDE